MSEAVSLPSSRALVFSGFGGEFPGMGMDLLGYSAAQKVFAEADAIFGKTGTFSLSHVMFHGPKDLLSSLAYLPSALTAVGVATVRVLEEQDRNFWERTRFIAGHSFGLVTGLAAAGMITLKDVNALFHAASAAITSSESMKTSAMLLVFGKDLSFDTAQDVIDRNKLSCVVANVNMPGQVVISGMNAEISVFKSVAQGRGWKVADFNPGLPAHSPLMSPVDDAFEPIVRDMQMGSLKGGVGFIDYSRAEAIRDVAEIKKSLTGFLSAPVNWVGSVQHMIAGGANEFVECGTQMVGKMIARIDPNARIASLIDSSAIETYCNKNPPDIREGVGSVRDAGVFAPAVK